MELEMETELLVAIWNGICTQCKEKNNFPLLDLRDEAVFHDLQQYADFMKREAMAAAKVLMYQMECAIIGRERIEELYRTYINGAINVSNDRAFDQEFLIAIENYAGVNAFSRNKFRHQCIATSVAAIRDSNTPKYQLLLDAVRQYAFCHARNTITLRTLLAENPPDLIPDVIRELTEQFGYHELCAQRVTLYVATFHRAKKASDDV